MNIIKIIKSYWERLALAGVILIVIASLGAISSVLRSEPLQKCLSDRGTAWTAGNRAAEAAKVGIWSWKDTPEQKELLRSALCGSESLGFGVVTDFQKALSAPMTASQTFTPVTSLTLKDGTALSMDSLGSVVFLTLEPGATDEEIEACTGVDAATKHFTGCTRGLAFSGTSTAAVVANQKTHASGSTVVMSNVHYVYQQFLDLNGGPQYVTSTVVFNTLPQASSTTAVPFLDSQLVTKYYADNVTAGGFTSANVSSTLGLQAITTGIPGCQTAAACVGINASTTLAFDGSGKVYVNPTFGLAATFNAPALFNSSSSFAGTGSFRGGLNSYAYPTSSVDVANLEALRDFTATGTAGVALSSGQAVYMSSTSSLFVADSSVATTSAPFVGFAFGSYTAGQTAAYVRPGGIVRTSSVLVPGTYYYLSTAGALSASAGTIPVRVGVAVGTSLLMVQKPTFRAVVRGSSTNLCNGTQSFTLGFVPTKITAYCSGNSNAASQGEWWSLSNGASSSYAVGTGSASTFWQTSLSGLPNPPSKICDWNESATNFSVAVVTSTLGFSLQCSQGASARDMAWTAEYDEQ